MTTRNFRFIVPLIAILAAPAYAGDTLDAAVGGGLGGAAGAAVGNEIGGRQGAIIGGALGAATGAAITTSGDGREHRRSYGEHPAYPPYPAYNGPRSNGHFCLPGQAKKGRC